MRRWGSGAFAGMPSRHAPADAPAAAVKPKLKRERASRTHTWGVERAPRVAHVSVAKYGASC